MIRVFLLCAAAVLLYFWASGGFNGSVPVGGTKPVAVSDLLTHSDDYEGARVLVRGTVTGRASLLGYGGFYLRDDQGSAILVLSGTTPLAPGSSVAIQGRYLSAFTLGQSVLPVVVAEQLP